jgi:hypothetical protein
MWLFFPLELRINVNEVGYKYCDGIHKVAEAVRINKYSEKSCVAFGFS